MRHAARFVSALGSTKLTLVILAVFAVAIAVATFIEAALGTPAARGLVYNARWFEFVIVLFVVNVILSLLRHLPFKVRQTGFVITHTGFIVVLIAAGVTRYFGYEGTMPIREGSATDYMYSVEDYIHVGIGDEESAFRVRLFKSGATSINRDVRVGDDRLRVSVLEFLTHAERQIVEGPGGDPVIVLGVEGGGDDIVLHLGDRREVGGTWIRFVAELGDDGEVMSGPYGDLVIDGTHRLAVPDPPPAELNHEGYHYRITEFAPDFRVGRTPQAGDEMNNPAIRVQVTSPEGKTSERLLFAFHPDFDMGHSGADEDQAGPTLSYEYARDVYLAMVGDDVFVRADVPLTFDADGRKLAAGTKAPLAVGNRIRAGLTVFEARAAWTSAVERHVNVPGSNAPAAVRVRVADNAGHTGEAVVRKRRGTETVDIDGKSVAVAFGPKRIQLPYRLHLDDFVLKTYPGSQNPASFESHVRVFDETRGMNGVPVRIYMNHPLGYRGYKHFQSSYDEDRLGTILSVNHDPGKWPTYIGYIMIGVGFLITLTRGIWYRKAVI